MPDVDIDTALEWRGRTVVDRAGEKIGTLKDIYLDASERPQWGSVQTGLFGTRETLVPLDQADPEQDVLRLPFEGDHVKEAPNVDPDVQLSAEEEQQLYRHYGRSSPPDDTSEAGAVAAGPEDAAAEPDERSDDAMTRSEEVVRFGTRRRERGRARLKKYVVTDYVEKKVPVRREEVRLEVDGEERTDDGDSGR